MWLFAGMKKNDYANDDEPLTFQALGLAAALVINRIRNAQALRELVHLDKEQEEDRSRDTGGGKTDEQREKDHREAVESRLRQLRTFERRVNGRD
jgi:hypothetical protein